MRARTQRPETVKIEISYGDWILVKKHLNAGEVQDMYKNMMRKVGTVEVEALNVGNAKLVAYLIDWSFRSYADEPLVIRGESEEIVREILRALDEPTFEELVRVIDAHRAAAAAELDEEKKLPDGAIASSQTLHSAA